MFIRFFWPITKKFVFVFSLKSREQKLYIARNHKDKNFALKQTPEVHLICFFGNPSGPCLTATFHIPLELRIVAINLRKWQPCRIFSCSVGVRANSVETSRRRTLVKELMQSKE